MLEITHGVPGVLPAQLDLSGEGQVVAEEDPGTGDEAGRVGLVAAVSEADDPSRDKEGEVSLEAGFHRFVMDYYRYVNHSPHTTMFKGPGFDWKKIPNEDLYCDPGKDSN